MNELPDPTEDPLNAAYQMLEQTRDDMSGDLYEGNEPVREWAINLEWTLTALAEHEDVNP